MTARVRTISEMRGVAWASIFAIAIACALPSVGVAQRRRDRDRDRGPARGTLVVTCPQAGAEVLVDEALVGTTPIDALELDAGSHTLRVRLPGYSEYTDVVTITRGDTAEVAVELFALSEVLHVVSDPPGARVFVDGNFMGETPVEVELLEGAHSLRLTLRGYHEIIRELAATAGAREEVSLTLEALPASALGEDGTPRQPEWYEEPVTWIAVGGGALAIAAIVVIVVIATSATGETVQGLCGQMCDTLYRPWQ